MGMLLLISGTLAGVARAETGAEGGSPAAPPEQKKGQVIWTGKSGGFEIRWTTADIQARPLKKPGGAVFSAAQLSRRGFQTFISPPNLTGSEKHIAYGRTFTLLSVVGSIVSLKDELYYEITPSAHPGGEIRFTAIDLAKPGKVPDPWAKEEGLSLTELGKVAKLTDYFPEQEVLKALLDQAIIQEALSGESPPSLAQLFNLLKEQHIMINDIPYLFPQDFLTRFAFHHLEGEKVAVGLSLSAGGAFRSLPPELVLLLPIPPALKNSLALAASGQEGFLRRDQERLSEGRNTIIRFTKGKKPPGWEEVKYGFIDHTGKMVISPQFDFAKGFSEGKAAVKVGGKWGFIDQGGQLVIRPQFTYAHSFSEGLAWVDLGEDKYALIDGMGKTIRLFQGKNYIFNEFKDFSHGLARIVIGDEKGFRHGFIDRTGKFAIPGQFREAGDFSEGLAPVRTDGTWGFIDSRGELVIPSRFDEVDYYDPEDPKGVIQGKPGMAEGLAAVKLEGRWDFIDRQGRMVTHHRFEGAYQFSEGLARVKIDGKWGYIDRTGAMVIPPQFEGGVERFSEGLAAVWIPKEGSYKEGKIGFIDRQGNLVIPAKFDLRRFEEDASDDFPRFSQGLARITIKDKFGFIDRQGKLVIAAKFQEAGHFAEGLAPVAVIRRAASKDGARKTWGGSPAAEPTALFPVRKQGKYGFIERTGKIIIKTRFEDVGEFFEGRALVQIAGKWGYLDNAGKVVIEPRFDFANPFYDGLALVKKDKGEYFINPDGKVVIDVSGQSAGFFHEGRAMIKKSGKIGFIDRTGRIVIQPRFDRGAGFSEGLAGVKQEGKWGFINLPGTLVIPPQFEDVGIFAEGLAAVELQGKYGFIDKAGKVVIEPQYEFARHFAEGLAAVRSKDRYGYIDGQGRMVIPPQFLEAYPFSEGLAWVDLGERLGAIDRSGKVLWTMPSGLPGQFKNGLAHFQNQQSGYLDRTGKIIWVDTD
jgi:hypothetical protein